MKLYKFRSFENIEFTLDIILNNQLYCSPHQDLNDPFEGLFAALEWRGGGIVSSLVKPLVQPLVSPLVQSTQSTVFKSISDILAAEKEVRVCSLSRSLSDVRMWSHYAASHTGIAIEIELDIENEDCLYEVEYYPGIKKFTTDSAEPSRILSFKTDHWAHEKEYRIISEESFYPIDGKITGIYFGIRSKALHREMIKKITSDEIPLYETKINEETVEVIASDLLN